MNKTAIKNFAIWARNKLIADISYRAGLMGITESGIAKPLPQSTGATEFYDIGTAEPYSISGHQVVQRSQLVEAIRRKGRDTDYKTAYNYIMEEVAYTWFNRLIAVRFMEVNDYLPSHIRVLSSETGKHEPDLVTTPFDADLPFTAQEEATLIQMKQDNKLDEAFRLLFIKQCNALNEILPALFEVTGHYTELLLNLSVIDQDGVVWHLVHDIDEADFDVNRGGQVEIIGWLYQYYNTEPKDETFALLKKNVKITKERIPSATQLFTPDWIVRYMVENSLGRLWVEGHPNDALKSEWKYYLDEAEQEPDVQAQLEEIRQEYRTLNLEDIRVIDPCMGSGHILVYAFDVLMQIYESQGYTQRDAAQSILQNNLYGLDIDERAAQLAYFAVMMKARQYDRRIFSRGIQPHVYAIVESNGLSGLWTKDNKEMRMLFDIMQDAKEYGSILTVPALNFEGLRQYARNKVAEIEQFDLESNYLQEQLPQVFELIDVAELLSQRYSVCCTNPPYMGSSNMSSHLSNFIKDNYPNGKNDLFAAFVYQCQRLAMKTGFVAMITQHGWLFLSSYEKMRVDCLQSSDVVNMAHLGARAFDEISGEVVQTVAFVLRRKVNDNYLSKYERLIDGVSEKDKEHLFLSGQDTEYKMGADTINSIPGHLFAYWLDDVFINHLVNDRKMGDYGVTKQGLITSDNDRFLRFWYEVDPQKIGVKWFMYNKGGGFRRWYGNICYVVNWENDGFEICHFTDSKGKLKSRPQNTQFFFRKGLTWNDVSTARFCCRIVDGDCAFDASGPMLFLNDESNLLYFLGLMNSSITQEFMNLICQGLHYSTGHIPQIPVQLSDQELVKEIVEENVLITKEDWDSFETSADFERHPLV